MSEALDRLNELRDLNDDPTAADIQRYSQMEREIKRHDQYADYLNHPITKVVAERILDWIKEADQKLLSGKAEATEALHRDILIEVLRIFSPAMANAKRVVEDIDDEIKQWKEWSKGRV